MTKGYISLSDYIWSLYKTHKENFPETEEYKDLLKSFSKEKLREAFLKAKEKYTVKI